ncbi:unnamed protein product [Adineta steineri]|uniref:Uncharacterized protein n=1 Tax=Adineta steineri TaxID=433720 RepID=A0A815TRB2_9BILA|nr:unnamed protein product [Adineta steineri]CAF4132468.1 unnamed protein product [Adineta steineri]
MPKTENKHSPQSKYEEKKNTAGEVRTHSNSSDSEGNFQADRNGSVEEHSKISIQTEGHSKESVNEKSNKDLIVSYVKRFLEQQSDFTWLTQKFERSAGSDHFQNLVVRSTFPTTLTSTDFEYYIDMTFNDFPTNLRTQMKHLYQQSNHNPISEDIIFGNHENDAVSATLIQILSQKNDRDELEMLVGSISLIRRPLEGYQFPASYLKEHKDRIKTALQYMYGKEAQQELSYE